MHAALNQSETAERVGLSQSAFSTIEQGAAPLSEGLCASLADIYGEPQGAVRDAWQRANDTLKGFPQ